MREVDQMKEENKNKKKKDRLWVHWIVPILALGFDFFAWTKGVDKFLILMGFYLAIGMILKNLRIIKERNNERRKEREELS